MPDDNPGWSTIENLIFVCYSNVKFTIRPPTTNYLTLIKPREYERKALKRHL